jgi:endonuclease YncB( thermonuclease family)
MACTARWRTGSTGIEPENRVAGGRVLDASHALSKLIGRKPVSCTRRDTDRYGRMVAVCSVEGMDISKWMVTRGQAIAFRKYSLDYVGEEDRAKAAKIGTLAGEFQDPSASAFEHLVRASAMPIPATENARRHCARCLLRQGRG